MTKTRHENLGCTFQIGIRELGHVFAIEPGEKPRKVLERAFPGYLEPRNKEAVHAALGLENAPRPVTLVYWVRGGSELDYRNVRVIELYKPGHPTQVVWKVEGHSPHFLDPFRRGFAHRAALGYPYTQPFGGTSTTNPLEALRAGTFSAYAFRFLVSPKDLGQHAPNARDIEQLLRIEPNWRNQELRQGLSDNPVLHANARRYVGLLKAGYLPTPSSVQDSHVEGLLRENLLSAFLEALDHFPRIRINDSELLKRFAKGALQLSGLSRSHAVVFALIFAGHDPERILDVQIPNELLADLFDGSLPLIATLVPELSSTTRRYVRRAAVAYVKSREVIRPKIYWTTFALEAVLLEAGRYGKTLHFDLNQGGVVAMATKFKHMNPHVLQRLAEEVARREVEVTWNARSALLAELKRHAPDPVAIGLEELRQEIKGYEKLTLPNVRRFFSKYAGEIPKALLVAELLTVTPTNSAKRWLEGQIPRAA